MKLEITQEERDEMLRLVENYLSETRVEARHSQTHEYRDRLHIEEDLLRGLKDKLIRATEIPAMPLG